MKDYEFRFWLKKGFEWHKGIKSVRYEMMYPDDKWMRWPVLDLKTQTLMEGEGGMISDSPMTSMLYIGEKDCNGKKIYEDDIVKSEGYKPMMHNETSYFRVQYRECGFDPFNVKGWEAQLEPNECEVVGNIHENPELMLLIK